MWSRRSGRLLSIALLTIRQNGVAMNLMQDVLASLPARPLTPDERALLAEWLAAAGDVAAAYASGRKTDDPALKNRIVVFSHSGEAPSHLIHAPAAGNVWMMVWLGRRSRWRQFKTLRAALNAIRPVLGRVETDGSLSNGGSF